MTDDTVALDIPKAKGKVSVEGADRILYKVLLNGEPLKRQRGAWRIPLAGGKTGELRSRGFIPGFQTLSYEGEDVLRMGADVGVTARFAAFSPLLLVIFSFPGLALGLALFFMNVMAVKNPLLPKPVRIGLPIANTVAGFAILLLLPAAFA